MVTIAERLLSPWEECINTFLDTMASDKSPNKKNLTSRISGIVTLIFGMGTVAGIEESFKWILVTGLTPAFRNWRHFPSVVIEPPTKEDLANLTNLKSAFGLFVISFILFEISVVVRHYLLKPEEKNAKKPE